MEIAGAGQQWDGNEDHKLFIVLGQSDYHWSGVKLAPSGLFERIGSVTTSGEQENLSVQEEWRDISDK